MRRPPPEELPVSIDFYYLVGRITVISSLLEKSTFWLLEYLRHNHITPDLDGWEYEEKKTRRFADKARAIRSLTGRRGWMTPEREFVSEWLDAVESFREVRNDLAHSYWLHTTDSEEHTKYTLDEREWRFEDGPVTLHQLREHVTRGESVMHQKDYVADLALAYLWSGDSGASGANQPAFEP